MHAHWICVYRKGARKGELSHRDQGGWQIQGYRPLSHSLDAKYEPTKTVDKLIFKNSGGFHTASCAAVSAKSSLSSRLIGEGEPLACSKITASMRFRSNGPSCAALVPEEEPTACAGDNARVVEGGEGVERRGRFRCLRLDDAEEVGIFSRSGIESVSSRRGCCIKFLKSSYVESSLDMLARVCRTMADNG